MESYFERDGIVLFHGDCREILPSLGTFDLVLTDPPYGISYDPKNRSRQRNNRPYWSGDARDFEQVVGDDEQFDPRPLLSLAPKGILWGANNFAHLLPPQSKWLVWDKKAGKAAKSDIGDCELAYMWGSGKRAVRMLSHMWAGFQRDSECGQKHLHPTQKPIALMTWCLEQAGECRTLVDPYVGSGASLIAARNKGIRAIGIEIVEAYCEITAKRLLGELEMRVSRPSGLGEKE